MDLLRFITAGSVDDGKSTLIGRLLYDSKSIMIDHLEALEKQSKNKEDGEIDLALLTDGLRAEREQGITIDVAYKYFATPKRKFIIADAPGHIQYTRNMVTGASNSDLAIILIDELARLLQHESPFGRRVLKQDQGRVARYRSSRRWLAETLFVRGESPPGPVCCLSSMPLELLQGPR